MSEKRLIRKARQFDQVALGEIYDTYSDPLYKYAVRRVGNPQLAEDFVAETFQRFLEALEKGGGPDDYLQAYLYRITHNLITDHYRREPPPPLQLEEDRIQSDLDQPAQIVGQHIQAERVRRALRLLTPGQQQVIVLKYLQGWSNQEVARAMDKTVGAIKSQAHRALNALERILLEEEENLQSPAENDSS
jgi:RNA polymerase sigma-70 factor (ECF subfamily)